MTQNHSTAGGILLNLGKTPALDTLALARLDTKTQA